MIGNILKEQKNYVDADVVFSTESAEIIVRKIDMILL